jgi:hypothetical protein
MAGDFTKLPFPGIENLRAATLTEAIARDPVSSGFVLVTVKADEPDAFVQVIRGFARAARAEAADSGLVDITAYRQLRRDELGGAVPFDQAICERLIEAAKSRESSRQMGLMAEAIALTNPRANWVILLEYYTPERAAAAARLFTERTDAAMGVLTSTATEHTVGAFKNMKGYATVSRDPAIIQFFNLFGAPGDPDVLWPAWEEALPWFFEVAEFRSSFPLLALDPNQPLLLVNYAHLDSTKHFLVGTIYDPSFMELMTASYFRRGVTAPLPLFCKIVPV